MRTNAIFCSTAMVSLFGLLSASAAVRYVNVNNATATPPYTTWATAANVIQDAVDVASAGDEIVVTNGVYGTGGRVLHGMLTNRVAVTKPLVLRSVNGPDATIIRGAQISGSIDGPAAVRCAYLTNGANLIGFAIEGGTLTNQLGDPSDPVARYLVSGGGIWCESESVTVSNCIIRGNSANFGGGVCQGTLLNCTVSNNVAEISGGGAFLASLSASVVKNNHARYGGGANRGTLVDCIIMGNSATQGAGANGASLSNCELRANVAMGNGGGASGSSLGNCLVVNNIASDGGGAWGSTVINCTVMGNTALAGIGGVSGTCWSGGMPGCNTDSRPPWGFYDPPNCSHYPASVYNCIVYYNHGQEPNLAPVPVFSDPFVQEVNDGCNGVWFSCTFPAREGTGNITNAPLFIDAASSNFRLRAGSPCINAGRNTDAPAGLDLDGNPRVAGVAVDMGAYEFQPVVHYVSGNSANPTPPYTNWATAAEVIQDAIDVALAGDEIVVTNGVYQSGGRGLNGVGSNRVAVTKPVLLRSVNGPEVTAIHGYPPGTTNFDAAVRCVYLTNGATLVGFTLMNGATRQWSGGGGVWCESTNAVVSNCALIGNSAHFNGGAAYSGTLNDCTIVGNHAVKGGGVHGSTLINCTLAGNSADGDGGGPIDGGGWAVYVGPREGGGACQSVLIGCMLSDNSARNTGGGAAFSTLNNCNLIGNSASLGGGTYFGTAANCILTVNSAVSGGGSYSTRLDGCAVISNRAQTGGGAFGSMLNNCTVTGNSATDRAGGFFGVAPCNGSLPFCGSVCEESGCSAEGGTLNNCIVYYNDAPIAPNFSFDATFNHSCTSPIPTDGVGNITNAPLFMDAASGNFRLQSNSPCINSGRNVFAPGGPDLDGNPRIVGGTVDIGAYEFQSPQSVLSYAWLQQYGLPTDGSADLLDLDGDGQNNWQERRAWTDPTNSLSALRLLMPIVNTNGLLVRWEGVNGRLYSLERSTNLSAFEIIASNLTSALNATTFADTNALSFKTLVYRIRVQE